MSRWPYIFSLLAAGFFARAETMVPAGRALRVAQAPEGVHLYLTVSEPVAMGALERQGFPANAGFKLEKQVWLRTSFGWAMHKSGFGTQPRLARLLRVTVPHAYFDELLTRAVPTTRGCAAAFDEGEDVRARKADTFYQWDPEWSRRGERVGRSTLQIGIRGAALLEFTREAVTKVVDVTWAARAMREDSSERYRRLAPAETEYDVDSRSRARLGL